MSTPAQASKQIKVQIPEELEAVYSNFAMITHSASEIIVDFARLFPNAPRSKVDARIVMTPVNAKLLLKALETNLQKYEEQFGEIKMPDKSFPEERSIGFSH